MQSATPADTGKKFPLNTDEFAARNGVKSQSVRSRVCRIGSYFGVTPKKLANGRLKWPDVQLEETAEGVVTDEGQP